MSLTYPAGAPAVNGNQLTVNRLLKAPTVLEKRIVTNDTKFLSDLIFRPGTTDSGAVIYNKAALSDKYPTRGDVHQIEPGAEYPMVDTDEGGAEVALSTKWGAGYVVTDEAKKRNQLNVVQKGNLKVRNALLRQDAARALAAFEANVPTVNAVGTWDTPKAFKTDILTNIATIKNLQLGYNPKTILINPDTATTLLLLDELQNWAPRENTSLNPLYNPSLNGLLGLNWIENEFVAPSQAIILEAGVTGANIVESPYRVEVVREGTRGRDVVLADKWSVPIIDEPESALVINGVAA